MTDTQPFDPRLVRAVIAYHDDAELIAAIAEVKPKLTAQITAAALYAVTDDEGFRAFLAGESSALFTGTSLTGLALGGIGDILDQTEAGK